jgi:hypothetical protein
MNKEAVVELAKRLGWMLVGVVVGAVLMGAITIGAQSNVRPPTPEITIGDPSYNDTHNFRYIKSPRSKDCWLYVTSRHKDDNAVAIAPASEAACNREK